MYATAHWLVSPRRSSTGVVVGGGVGGGVVIGGVVGVGVGVGGVGDVVVAALLALFSVVLVLLMVSLIVWRCDDEATITYEQHVIELEALCLENGEDDCRSR